MSKSLAIVALGIGAIGAAYYFTVYKKSNVAKNDQSSWLDKFLGVDGETTRESQSQQQTKNASQSAEANLTKLGSTFPPLLAVTAAGSWLWHQIGDRL